MLSNCLFYVYAREEEREYPTSRASFCFLAWGGEKDSLSESRQPFEVVEDQTSEPVNLVLSPQTVFFFEREHPFIDKPIVITEPAVPSGQLLGLCSKLYPSNMQRMLNKDLTRFKQSFSRVHQNQACERKALDLLTG